MSTKVNRQFRPVLVCLEDRLAPAMITVTAKADIVNPRDGKISLREAITKANATNAPDTIVLAAGVYSIGLADAGEDANASGDFDVTGPLTIMGQGARKTFVDGAQLDRLFDIRGAVKVRFADLTLRNGATPDNGGAIQVTQANLQLTNCVVRDNTAKAGGGIFANTTVTLRNSTVLGNFAGSAGGIFAGTSVTLIKSKVLGNRSDGDFGGIFASTTVTLTKSNVSNNVAGGGDGGIAAGDAVTLIDSTVSGNSALNGVGGIDANTSVTLIKSTVSGNSSGTSAGGIVANTVTLTKSTVTSNSAKFDGGGIQAETATLASSIVAGNTAGGSGGGIRASHVTLTNSTVSGNSAADSGAGISTKTVTLTNSTVSGNTAASGSGGGIEAVTAILINCTVSGNSAAVDGGGLYVNEGRLLHATITQNSAHTGGGVSRNPVGAFTFKNTIIAQNHVDSTGTGPDVFGDFDSLGRNLIGVTDGGTGFSSATDLLGTAASPLDPKLGPLKNNGGPTQTHALLGGSAAIDAGANDRLATLTAPVKARDAILFVDNAASFAPGTAVRLGREVVIVLTASAIKQRLTVQRAGPMKRAAHAAGTGLFLATDQRGINRPRDGDGNGSRLVDIGAFEV